MAKLFIPVLLGTAREGRRSENVANFVLEQAEKSGVKTELIDVRHYAYTSTEADADVSHVKETEEYREIIKKADGLIIVAPEYNHGYPGELKQLIDAIYPEYEKKPVAICGVSTGGLGGARMVEQLQLVAIGLRMVPLKKALYFSRVKELFNEKGEMQDPEFAERAQAMFSDLKWYAEVLKAARNGV